MTRFLEKDKGTQVNSNLIGVQVRPEVVPPTYEVNELTANVRVRKYMCDTDWNNKPMVYFQDGSIWGYSGSGNNLDVNGVTYNAWECLNGQSKLVPGGVVYIQDGTTITDNTQFYIYRDDPSAPDPMMPGPVSDYKLDTNGYSGFVYRFDPIDTYVYMSDSADTCSLIDGFVLNKDKGLWIGKTLFSNFYDEQFTCAFWSESGVYFQWRIDHLGEIYLFSTIRNPYVGYNLISNNSGTEVYSSPVTSVSKKEVDPGYTESVDCSVEYSVDGETWTAWEKNLTDDNNVIANIPRYMYLKFGQDVEITEE